MKKLGVGLILIVFVAFLVVTYFVFFHASKCSEINCWEYKLKECKKAKYVNHDIDVSWEYEIKGKERDSCEVEVEALQVVTGLARSRIIEGKSMNCFIPLDNEGKTIVVAPEADINLCHGRLKEELQTLMIEKLHQYVLENVGEIAEGLTGVEGVVGGDEGNSSGNETDNV